MKLLAKAALLLGLFIAQQAFAVGYVLESVGTFAGNGTGNALTPGLPATCPTNSLMVLFASGRGNGQSLSVTGWTELYSVTSGGTTKILARLKQGGDTAPSVNFSGSDYATAQIACFSGDVHTDLATILVSGANTFANNTSFNYPSLSVSLDNSLVVIAGKHNKGTASDGITVSAEAGFTELGEFSPVGTGSSFAVWNYVQQTTAANIVGGGWDTTNGTPEDVGWNGVTIALKSSAAATPPSFSATPTVTAKTASAYTLTSTPNVNSSWYAVAYKTTLSAPTCSQIKAGNDSGDASAIAAANKGITGVDSLVLSIPGGTPRPKHNIASCLSNAVGDSSVSTLTNQFLNAPNGKQFVEITSIHSLSWCVPFNTAATPDLVAGDIVKADLITTPAGRGWSQRPDCSGFYPGDGSKQVVTYDVFDASADAYMAGGPGRLVFNNSAPQSDDPNPDTFLLDENHFEINLCDDFIDIDGDSTTPTNSSTGAGTGVDKHPANTTISSCLWSGDPTTDASGSFVFTMTDLDGDAGTKQINWVVQTSSTVPDCQTAHLEITACTDLLDAEGLLYNITTEANNAIAADAVIRQDPPPLTVVESGSTVNLAKSSGPSTENKRGSVQIGIRIRVK